MDAIIPQLARLLFHNRPSLVVIASAAKQSTLAFLSPHGLLRGACHRARMRATRWLAMTVRYDFAFSPRDAPEFCIKVPPSEIRGRRESRVPVAPAAARVE